MALDGRSFLWTSVGSQLSDQMADGCLVGGLGMTRADNLVVIWPTAAAMRWRKRQCCPVFIKCIYKHTEHETFSLSSQ